MSKIIDFEDRISTLRAAIRNDPAAQKAILGHFSDYINAMSTVTVCGENGLCCMAGLRLIEKLCASRGLSWGQVFPVALDGCARYLQFAAREYLLDGGDSNKSVVEQTLEVMDRMGLDPDSCKELEGGALIAIHFKSVYDRLTKYRRDFAIVGECLPYAQFMRQLRKSDLYVESRAVRFGSDTRKAILLDYRLLRQRCDVSGFMGTEIKPLSGDL